MAFLLSSTVNVQHEPELSEKRSWRLTSWTSPNNSIKITDQFSNELVDIIKAS